MGVNGSACAIASKSIGLPQTPGELEKAIVIGWWIVSVAALQRNEPAILLHRKENPSSLDFRRRSLNKERAPIAARILRPKKHLTGIADVRIDAINFRFR